MNTLLSWILRLVRGYLPALTLLQHLQAAQMLANQRYYPIMQRLDDVEQRADSLAWYDPCDLCGLCDGAIVDDNYVELYGEILHPNCAHALGEGAKQMFAPIRNTNTILRKKGTK